MARNTALSKKLRRFWVRGLSVNSCTIPAAVPREIPFSTDFHLLIQRQLADNNGRNPITVYRYSRADLLRILRLTARQLGGWEKAGLVAVAESYSFFDLLQIKKVRDLCAKKVRP